MKNEGNNNMLLGSKTGGCRMRRKLSRALAILLVAATTVTSIPTGSVYAETIGQSAGDLAQSAVNPEENAENPEESTENLNTADTLSGTEVLTDTAGEGTNASETGEEGAADSAQKADGTKASDETLQSEDTLKDETADKADETEADEADKADDTETDETDKDDADKKDESEDDAEDSDYGIVLSLEQIEEKEELSEVLEDMGDAAEGTDYAAGRVMMWADTKEEAETAAAAYTKATGQQVLLDSYECQIAVLILTGVPAKDAEDAEDAEDADESGSKEADNEGDTDNEGETDNEGDTDNEGETLESTDIDTEDTGDAEAITALDVEDVIELAADTDKPLPAVYPIYRAKADSVGSTVTVNTVNEHGQTVTEGDNQVSSPYNFEDPYLGELGETDDAATQDSARYQWYHELINDKFIFNEMHELSLQGSDYQGPLNSDFNTNLANVTVAVIDSGLNSDHEDFSGVPIRDGKSFITYTIAKKNPTDEEKSAGTDTDKFDDPFGYDDSYVGFGGGHGSNVAGIVASKADNKSGGRGVAAGAGIMPLKVFSVDDDTRVAAEDKANEYKNGYYAVLKKNGNDTLTNKYLDSENYAMYSNGGEDDTIMRAINYAIYHSHEYVSENPNGNGKDPDGNALCDDNVRVVNMSLGSSSANPLYKKIVNLAAKYNVLLVSTAGNEATEGLKYPSCLDGVINVASLNADYQLSSYSSRQPSVAIAAPGGDMRPDGTYDNDDRYYEQYMYAPNAKQYDDVTKETPTLDVNRYVGMHGTSQAAPVVAAVLALMAAQYPDLSAEELYSKLISSARTIKTTSQYVTKCVDAAKALGIDTTNKVTKISACVEKTDPETNEKTYEEVSVNAVPADGYVTAYAANSRHSVFYYTISGKDPVIDKNAVEFEYNEGSGYTLPSNVTNPKTATYVSTDGYISLDTLVRNNIISNKGTVTFKVKALLYGVQSPAVTQKVTIRTTEYSTLSIAPQDGRKLTETEDSEGTVIRTADLALGRKLQLKATYADADATRKVVWTSSDPSVATVSAAGQVVSKALGDTVITAKLISESVETEEKITISVKTPTKSINLSSGENTIYINYDNDSGQYRTYELYIRDEANTLTVLPQEASRQFVFKTANAKVATVDNTGTIRGVVPGTTKVTITAADGTNVSKTVNVVVSNSEIYATISTKEAMLRTGASTTGKVTYDPINKMPSGAKVEWYLREDKAPIYLTGPNAGKVVEDSFKASDYITVTTAGKITAGKKITYGVKFTVGIKIKYKDGTYSSYQDNDSDNNMVVNIYPAVTSLSFSEKTIETVYDYDGATNGSLEDYILVSPEYTLGEYTLTSSNQKVVVIPDAAALKYTVVGAGRAVLTLKANDGSGRKATITVNAAKDHVKQLYPYIKGNNNIIYPGKSLTVAYSTNSTSDNFPDKEAAEYWFDGGQDEDGNTIHAYETDYLTINKKTGVIKTKAALKEAELVDVGAAGDENAVERDLYVYVTRNVWVWDDAENKWGSAARTASVLISMYSKATAKVTACKVTSEGREAIEGNVLNLTAVGQRVVISATSDEDACQIGYTYKSSNEKVVQVLSVGNTDASVVATGQGSANVTITAGDGSGKKTTVRVNVVQPVTSIDLAAKTGVSAIGAGKSLAFTATLNSTATNKKLRWALAKVTQNAETGEDEVGDEYTSEDAKEAGTISASGVYKAPATVTPIEGKGYMELYVTANATDGSEVQGAFKLKVTPLTTGIKLFDPEEYIKTEDRSPLDKNQSIAIYADGTMGTMYVVPETYTDKALEEKGGASAANEYTVTSSNVKAAAAEWVRIKKTAEGEWTDADTTDDDTLAVKVTAVAKGSANVTIKANDGSNKSAAIKVTVNPEVSYLSIAPKNNQDYVVAGKNLQMTATVNTNASNKKIKWTITKSDPELSNIADYATIDPSSGLIKTVKTVEEGGRKVDVVKEIALTVTATPMDALDESGNPKEGAITKECTVYINKKLKNIKVKPATVNTDGSATIALGKSMSFSAATDTAACNMKVTWDFEKAVDEYNRETGADGSLVSLSEDNTKVYYKTADDKKLIAEINKNNGTVKVDKAAVSGCLLYVRATAQDGGADGTGANAAAGSCRAYIGKSLTEVFAYQGSTRNSIKNITIGQGKTYTIKFGVRNADFDPAGEEDPSLYDDSFYVVDTAGYGEDAAAEVYTIADDEDANKIIGCTIKGKRCGDFTVTAVSNEHGGTCTINVTVAGSVLSEDANGGPVVTNGETSPYAVISGYAAPSYNNEESDISRFVVYVETDYDTDGDGKKDLVKVFVQVPRGAVEGKYQAGVIYDPTPYSAGTVQISSTNENLNRYYCIGEFDYNDLGSEGSKRTSESTISTSDLAAAAEVNSYYYKVPSNGIYATDVDTAYTSGSTYDYYLERGYAVAICCGIGTYGSEGFEVCGTKWETASHASVVNWLSGEKDVTAYADRTNNIKVESPHYTEDSVNKGWSNGNVAMTGTSYGGTIPFAVAALGKEKVPGLKTIISYGGIADWYDYTNSQGVTLYNFGDYTNSLALYNAGRLFNDFDGDIDMEKRYLTYEYQVAKDELLANGDYTAIWQASGEGSVGLDAYEEMINSSASYDCSAIIVSGLNDTNVRSKHADLMYRAFKAKNQNVKLLLHQCGHISLADMKLEMSDDSTTLDYNKEIDKWLNYYLNGKTDGNSVNTDLAEVNVQRNTDNKWLKYDSWASYDTEKKQFNLSYPGTYLDYKVSEFSTAGAAAKETVKISTDSNAVEDKSKTYEAIAGNNEVGSALMLLNLVDNDLAAGYKLTDSSTYSICGIPEVHLRITADTVATMYAKDDSNGSDLQALIRENDTSLDGMMLTAYLIDTYEDENHERQSFSANSGDVNEDKTGSATYTTTAKVISEGWLDISNPGGGYLNNDDAYKAPADLTDGSDKLLDHDYTLYMRPMYYTVEAGHTVYLVVTAYDPAKFNTQMKEYKKLESMFIEQTGTGYGFTINNASDATILRLPVVSVGE